MPWKDPEKNRAYRKRYRKSALGRATRAAWRPGYLASKHGKALHYASKVASRKRHWEKAVAYQKRYSLKYYYNLTIEEWNAIFEKQNRCCAICGSPYSGRKNGQWCTDHDHATGKVRGILCTGCNSALGHCKDDPSILRAAAKYLEEQEK